MRAMRALALAAVLQASSAFAQPAPASAAAGQVTGGGAVIAGATRRDDADRDPDRDQIFRGRSSRA